MKLIHYLKISSKFHNLTLYNLNNSIVESDNFDEIISQLTTRRLYLLTTVEKKAVKTKLRTKLDNSLI